LYGLTEERLEEVWSSEDTYISDYKAAKAKVSNEQFEAFHMGNHSIHYLLKPIEDGESDEKLLSSPVHLKKNLDLIPGRLTLHLFENKLAKHWSEAFLGEPQAIRIVTSIRKICEDYTSQFGYDVVLIDTSPSLGALNKIIISSADSFIIPCAPDMFSDYGIRNIGNALSVWSKEFNTMYSLLSDSKRKYFPSEFVKLLGYTVYNAKKRSDAPNELNVALAHYNYAKKIPSTIKDFIPNACLLNGGEEYFESSIGANSVIHGHGTLPTMAQKYKAPMWEVPDLLNLGEEKGTIKGNSKSYYGTRDGYMKFAQNVLDRLELL
jgi:cellulose biosynthesis protein BcsQ